MTQTKTFLSKRLSSGLVAVKDVLKLHRSDGKVQIFLTYGLNMHGGMSVPSVLEGDSFVSLEVLAKKKGVDVAVEFENLARQGATFYYQLHDLNYIATQSITAVGEDVSKNVLRIYLPLDITKDGIVSVDVSHELDFSVRDVLARRNLPIVLGRIGVGV